MVVPTLTAGALLMAHFDSGNYSDNGGFTPNGWSSVFTAVAVSGIVWAYNGFQSPLNMAGEARNPGKSLPKAVISSIIISLVIYVALQVAFLARSRPPTCRTAAGPACPSTPRSPTCPRPGA